MGHYFLSNPRIFERKTEILLRERKRHQENVAEEYYWTTTQAAWSSCCGLYGSGLSELGFQLDYLIDRMSAQL